jgi:ABC-2 type transport system ATP-binding protein
LGDDITFPERRTYMTNLSIEDFAPTSAVLDLVSEPVAAIEVRDLEKTYSDDIQAVKGISFQVQPGEVFGLLGPNGAGKSTTIGILTTTVRPTGGSAYVAGFDVITDPIGARRSASVVFQDPVVDRSLTGLRNLDTHARLWGVPRTTAENRTADLLNALDLAEVAGRPVSTYSGGQRRRLEIARALISRPEVLFLDEPTVGLDPRIRHELLDVIADLRSQNEMTILLTTHYLDEAEKLCDRIAIMHLGEIVALDTPAALLSSLGEQIVELRVQGDGEMALATLREEGIAGDDAFAIGSTLTVPLHDRPGGEAVAAIHRLPVATNSVAVRQPTLDDVYLQLTGNPLSEHTA